MTTLMLFLFVAVFGGAVGFVAGRVWEIRSGMQSGRPQRNDYDRLAASPGDLPTPGEPPMGF